MEYYIFNAVSPNAHAPYLNPPDDIYSIDAASGGRGSLGDSPIPIPVDIDDIDDDEETVYTDIINHGVMLYSDKLKTSLDDLGVENIGYFPVVLVDSESDRVVARYWLAMVVGFISCVDPENSRITQSPAGRTMISNFTIDEAKAQGYRLFRLDEKPTLVIISEKLKDALSRIGLEGVEFQNTKDYEDDI